MNNNFNSPQSAMNMPMNVANVLATTATGYTFTDVYMFSDEEGGAPFLFGKDNDANVLKTPQNSNFVSNNSNSDRPDENIPAELMEKFTFEKPVGVNGGLLTKINKPTTGLVFLGDLIDNQDCSIRALQAMCKLKSESPNQVLLIGGNRDYNKIRLGFELYITCGGELPWVGTYKNGNDGKEKVVTDFAGMVKKLKTSQCTFRKMDLPNYIKSAKLGAWNDPSKGNSNPMIAIERNFTSGKILDRVQRVYAATLGAGAGMKLFQKELNDMFPGAGVAALNQEDMAKVLCAVQMMMSFKWENLPGDCQGLNGLYLEYLRKSHALALFEIGGKYGVVSHGGFPMTYKSKDGNVKKTLTSPFGYIPEKAGFTTAAPLKTLIEGLENEKNELIDMVQSLRDTGYTNDETDRAHLIISKFVHLTALSSLNNGVDGANAFSSPIVGLQFIPIEARKGDLKVKLSGGSTKWINQNKAKSNANKKYLNTSGDIIIAYDIFGHMPQGFLPTAYREAGTTTLHVNLDVSKIDGASNNYSFAMLHLKIGQPDEFIGRYRMPPYSDKTLTYTLNTKQYAGKIVYYRQKISEGPVKLLKNSQDRSRFTEKMPIEVEIDGFDRMYKVGSTADKLLGLSIEGSSTLFQGGYHKGKRHTRKHKAKKSHKKTRKH